MVYFTCNHCGASLKKNAVAKHQSFRCQPTSLTCVDCLKDFHGQEYDHHTSCVTEEERYSVKGFQAKPPNNKGKLKQQSWIEFVHHFCATNRRLCPAQQKIVSKLQNQATIPKIKKKYQNFIRSICGYHVDPSAADILFDTLDAAYKAHQETEKANATGVKETPVSQEIIGKVQEKVTNGAELSMKKKEKKRLEPTSVEEASPISQEVQEEEQEKEKNEPDKKKKKLKPTSVEEALSISQEAVEEEQEKGKNRLELGKKKMMKLKPSSVEEALSISQEAVEEEQEKKKHGPELSKKERKEQRKRKKYEEVLREVEEAQPVEDQLTATPEKEESKTRKKKRKRDAEIANEAMENGDATKKMKVLKQVAEKEVESKGEKVKKSKKRKLQEENEEDADNVQKTGNAMPVNGTTAPKFDWKDTILALLEAATDKEISVKRLRNKVLAEYGSVSGGGHETEAQVMAKFNKKLSKIPRVVLLKDKAKLKC